MFLKLFCLLAAILAAEGVDLSGKCPRAKNLIKPDLNKLSGKWHLNMVASSSGTNRTLNDTSTQVLFSQTINDTFNLIDEQNKPFLKISEDQDNSDKNYLLAAEYDKYVIFSNCERETKKTNTTSVDEIIYIILRSDHLDEDTRTKIGNLSIIQVYADYKEIAFILNMTEKISVSQNESVARKEISNLDNITKTTENISTSHTIGSEQCPRVKNLIEPDLDKFSGSWHSAIIYPSNGVNTALNRSQMEFKHQDNNTYSFHTKDQNTRIGVESDAKNRTFLKLNKDQENGDLNYLLAAEYDKYAIFSNCKEESHMNNKTSVRETIYVISRGEHLDKVTKKTLLKSTILKEYMDQKYLDSILHNRGLSVHTTSILMLLCLNIRFILAYLFK